MAFRDEYDQAFFDRAGAALDRFCRFYFRFQLRGLDRLPHRPCLIVGNHSGLGTAELMCFVGAWWRRFGTQRRATGMMHDFFLGVPGIGHYYRAIGAVHASRANAKAALEAGHDVVVFPGGDLDACRPFYEPRKVYFGQRRGYVRIALETRVPIVPLATIGSHYTMLMAPGGETLARVLMLKRFFRTDRVPLPLNLLLLPARITSELLPAIDVASATDGMGDEASRIEHAHELVYGALSRAVAVQRHDRPTVQDGMAD